MPPNPEMVITDSTVVGPSAVSVSAALLESVMDSNAASILSSWSSVVEVSVNARWYPLILVRVSEVEELSVMLSISPLEVVSVSEVAAESVRDSVLSTVILNVSAAVEA